MAKVIAVFDNPSEIQGVTTSTKDETRFWEYFNQIPVGKYGLIPWNETEPEKKDKSMGFARMVSDSAKAYNKLHGAEVVKVGKGIVKDYNVPEDMWDEVDATEAERESGKVFRHCKMVFRALDNPNGKK